MKWPAPDRADVGEPTSGASASKTGWAMATCSAVAADHEAVAVVQAPHAAARAGVDEADASRGQTVRPAHRVAPVGVAAVDDHVARRQQLGQRRSTVDSVGSPAGTMTHTTRGRLAEGLRRARRATPRRCLAEGVVADDLVACAARAARPCSHPSARARPCPASRRPPPRARRGRPGRHADRGRAESPGRRRPAPARAWRSRRRGRGSSMSSSGRRRPPARTRRSAGPPCGAGRSSGGSAGRAEVVATPQPVAQRCAEPVSSWPTSRDAGVDEGLDGEVVARLTTARRLGERRHLEGSRPPVEHLLGRLLGRGHVGLVERVDAEQRRRTARSRSPTAAPGGRGRRASEPAAVRIDRMARAARTTARGAARRVGDDEQPVVAVDPGLGRRLADDGHDACAVLAGRLGHQLLEPQAERGDRRAARTSVSLSRPAGDAAAIAAAEAQRRVVRGIGRRDRTR